MQLTDKEALELGYMTQREFREKHNITLSNINYLMNRGTIDYAIFGNRRVVVLTPLTKTYIPNRNTPREAVMEA